MTKKPKQKQTTIEKKVPYLVAVRNPDGKQPTSRPYVDTRTGEKIPYRQAQNLAAKTEGFTSQSAKLKVVPAKNPTKGKSKRGERKKIASQTYDLIFSGFEYPEEFESLKKAVLRLTNNTIVYFQLLGLFAGGYGGTAVDDASEPLKIVNTYGMFASEAKELLKEEDSIQPICDLIAGQEISDEDIIQVTMVRRVGK